ncbi:MAG TPA: hypothetical protein VIW72_05130 [Burkholderiales bacterium]
MRIIAIIFLFLHVVAAYAAEFGYTMRSTELKDAPFSDAKTLATLPEKTKVEIISRQGAWLQVKEQQQGWVRLLSLRTGEGRTIGGDSGLESLINLGLGRSGNTGVTVATGVRGLSEADLKNARPNPQELEKLHQLTIPPAEAQKFAASAKLTAQQINYLPEPAQTQATGTSVPTPFGGER